MTDETEELRNLSIVLSANARALRKAADAARERSAFLKEMARIARDAAAKNRKQADSAGKRQAAR